MGNAQRYGLAYSPNGRRWRSSRISSAMLVHESRTRSPPLGHCGGRDDGCVVGTRDDGGGTGAGLRAGAAEGCGGGSGIFISISTTAESSLAISRVVWS